MASELWTAQQARDIWQAEPVRDENTLRDAVAADEAWRKLDFLVQHGAYRPGPSKRSSGPRGKVS